MSWSWKSPYAYLIASLYCWATFSFISNSVLAAHHILLGLAAVCFLFYKQGRIKEAPRSSLFLLGFALVAAISVLNNWSELHTPLKNLSRVKYPLLGAILAILTLHYRNQIKTKLGSLVGLFLFSFSLANVFGISKWLYQKFYLVEEPKRLSGFFGLSLSYGYTAVFPILLILSLLLNRDLCLKLRTQSLPKFFALLLRRSTLICLLVLAVICSVLSQTRGEFVGVLTALPFLFLFKNKRRFILITGATTIVLLAAIAYSFSGLSKNRLFKSAHDPNHTQRLAQLQVGYRAFAEKPFLGIGFRSFEERDPGLKEKYDIPHKNFVGHAHNNYMEVLATTGALGFVAFLLWILLWFIEIQCLQNVALKGLFSSVWVAFVVTGLFQSTFIDSEFVMTFYALYALSHAPRRNHDAA